MRWEGEPERKSSKVSFLKDACFTLTMVASDAEYQHTWGGKKYPYPSPVTINSIPWSMMMICERGISSHLLRVPQVKQCFHYSHHTRMRSCPHLCPHCVLGWLKLKMGGLIFNTCSRRSHIQCRSRLARKHHFPVKITFNIYLHLHSYLFKGHCYPFTLWI